MAIRTQVALLPQPLKWLAPGALALLTLAVLWLRARSARPMKMTPLSADWLHDLQRKPNREWD